MVLTTAESLAHLAVNPQERLEFVHNNLETALTHVRLNLPVSCMYEYYIKDGKIFCQGTELFIDPEERGGVYTEGLQKALSLAQQGGVVFFYSPPGPVVFDKNPENKYREIKKYKFGQLYLLWKEGDKFLNIAITTDRETDGLLKALFPECRDVEGIHNWFLQNQEDSVIEEIKRMILNPGVFEGSIEDFIDFIGTNFADQILYASDYSGKRYTGRDLSEMIRKSAAGESLLPEEYRYLVEIAQRYADYKTQISGGLSRDGILRAYLSVYSLSPEDLREIYGSCNNIETAVDDLLQRKIDSGFRLNLSGACGGGSFDLGSFFGSSFSPVESSFRSLQDIFTDTDRYGKREFDCPTCGNRIRRPYNKLVEVCPYCDKEIPRC